MKGGETGTGSQSQSCFGSAEGTGTLTKGWFSSWWGLSSSLQRGLTASHTPGPILTPLNHVGLPH